MACDGLAAGARVAQAAAEAKAAQREVAMLKEQLQELASNRLQQVGADAAPRSLCGGLWQGV